MAIKILPARLANQIAAGEVVERPASVVKELVENSIDSGATRIDIDIEKGGSKLIRVRDNGSGIAKDELGLALSRHATSKIHSLDDLEAIISLGFRGEALASISSVSRLTLTSRIATQSEAWSAYAEGRDMAVQLTPAAHPIGTTVEVVDLFFNTPARRKFLRTEKTEFTHIDELLKRIALSCFEVSITLRHNGKVIRQYRAAKNDIQIEKRIGVACGSSFMQHAVSIALDHNDLKLKGWITTPDGARSQSDLQYCYVNGRMMRDKLINHAIRQSYESALRPDQFATYVLFIEIDPHQVDVNVHPAKHEVRFHQARLVHDFIYQALRDGLSQVVDITAPAIAKSAYASPPQVDEQTEHSSQNEDLQGRDDSAQGKRNASQYISDQRQGYTVSTHQAWQTDDQDENSRPNANANANANTKAHSSRPRASSTSYHPKQSEVYRALFQTLDPIEKPECVEQPENHQSSHASESTEPNIITSLGKSLAVVQECYLLMQNPQSCLLVDLNKAASLKIQGQFLLNGEPSLKAQPLLIPLSLPLSLDLITTAASQHALLAQLGVELQAKGQHLMVVGVPQPLRQQNLQILIPELLGYLNRHQYDNQSGGEEITYQALSLWLTKHISVTQTRYTLSQAIQLVSELEQIWGTALPLQQYNWVQPVDFSSTLAVLQS
ncbi:DNA mismatch repair endonuclease MutL [Vibrio algicola]|uniref:DNA mismatch repair protein MutL n=1 Tax=Vibrio algicola TaxID=2662262 RepID=A0A5Q0TEU7_9VIBR|nr:DNA mismatch repair endonuclease MutL [Vibrio algicola]